MQPPNTLFWRRLFPLIALSLGFILGSLFPPPILWSQPRTVTFETHLVGCQSGSIIYAVQYDTLNAVPGWSEITPIPNGARISFMPLFWGDTESSARLRRVKVFAQDWLSHSYSDTVRIAVGDLDGAVVQLRFPCGRVRLHDFGEPQKMIRERGAK